ncbi:hypothetical protein [Halorhabdus tiamatea]|nr:hypothetical protein [Halorhabdus tiamatea]
MSLSKTVFRFLLVIMTFLALVTGFLFLLQKPGTGSYVVSVLTLVTQLSFILFLVVALRRDWEPLESLEEFDQLEDAEPPR